MRVQLAILPGLSEPEHAASPATSSCTNPLDLIRLEGVYRLESVYAASTALLTVPVDLMRQDKAVSLRQAQRPNKMPFGRAARAAARLVVRSLSAPPIAAATRL